MPQQNAQRFLVWHEDDTGSVAHITLDPVGELRSLLEAGHARVGCLPLAPDEPGEVGDIVHPGLPLVGGSDAADSGTAEGTCH
jgi:hypothetical protein